MDSKTKRAEHISLAAMLIGICTALVWIALLWLNSVQEIPYVLAIMMLLPLVASIAGIVLGIVGLVKSLRVRPRTGKGIAFAVIGIVLSLLTLCATAYFWLIVWAASAFA
ncbi:MAG: hypothetical protein IJL62_02060 [Clostridia bacterium]|nr:hypothetical protein [Clostridia bacterium]